jgi:ABC-2 type transport system ATP-binding protein
MDDIAIKVGGVSKTFKLPHEKHSSIKGALISLLGSGKRTFEKQEVLKDVSFEIKKGEFFGIVGRNGSGKSTLLKMLAGIYTPSAGNIQVNGKLTPFIELGVGFNPELTGRENVFLNGALLGFNRKEMEAMYDDIVSFAELGKFMDQKLKNYSSGMQVRLAFSIAIRAQTDILLLDEVLAVGDAAFQQKCVDVFEKYKASNRTVILVTHDMSTVKRFCSRAMLINAGEITAIGDPDKIAADYTVLNNASLDAERANKNKGLSASQVKVELRGGPTVQYGQELELVLDWHQLAPSVKNIGVAIYKNSGEYIYGTNTIIENIKLGDGKKAAYKIKAALGNGSYHLKVGLFGEDDGDVILFIENGPGFVVDDHETTWQGIMNVEHKWEIRNV